MRKLLSSSLVLILTVLSHAYVDAGVSKPAGLNVMLINSQELNNELRSAGSSVDWNTPTLKGLLCTNNHLVSDLISGTDLCRDLGHGCLLNAYLDKPELIFESFDDPCAASVNDQIVLRGLLNSIDKTEKKKSSDLFEKDHFFSLQAKIKESQLTVQAVYARWVQKIVDDASFTDTCLLNPMAFSSLRDIYNNERDPHRLAVLENIFSQALVLSVRSLQAGTFTNDPTYPFGADIMQNTNVYSLDVLYSQLKAIGGWPQFKALNQDERNALGGIYLRRTKDGSTWLVKAVYSSTDNVVWLDYSLPYNENIFVLAHELWHVAYAHTSAGNQELMALAELMNSPSVSDDVLKAAIFKMISRNELMAIQQQNLLYHGMGPYTASWGDDQSSARRWHDSYFGEKSLSLLRTRSERETFAGESPGLAKFDPGFGAMFSAAKIFAHAPGLIHVNHLSQSIGMDYWSEQVAKHHLFFDQIYLKGEFDYTQGERPDSSIVVDQQPWVMPLTCDKIARINRILGPNWEFGVPFSYSVQEDCSSGGPGQPGVDGGHPGVEGGHPGVDGGHPGVDGGHPGLEGFPSLDGPSEEDILNSK